MYENSIDLDWTIFLQGSEKVSDSDKKEYGEKECGDDVYDSDQLHTPPVSGDDEEHDKFSAYRSREGFKFQLSMVFNNKDIVRETLIDYAMEMKKNVFIKKNDGKRMVIKCMKGCKFYTKISKRVGNQFWHIVSLFYEHRYCRTPHNMQVKTKWMSMNNYTSDIFPRIRLFLEKNKKHVENWTPTWYGDDD